MTTVKQHLRAIKQAAPKVKKVWKCERCGKPLPKTGHVWKWRYQKWQAKHKATSGYYCDPCADSREQGMEY